MSKSITMTATECAREMSKIGIKSTAQKVVNGIECGAYPFGRIINKSSLRRCVEIYRVDFERWLAEKIPHEGDCNDNE